MGRLLSICSSIMLFTAACEQDSHVGDRPGGQPPPPAASGGLRVMNLVARVASQYSCPAGRLSPQDDVASCACDESPACDSLPGAPGPCLCDFDCVSGRPDIDCADYALTFTLQNGGAKAIERMSEVAVTVGQLSLREGGQRCDAAAWTLAAGVASGILDVTLFYNRSGSDRFAQPTLDYRCQDSGLVVKDPPSSGKLGDPLPPALTQGSVLLELRGLYADGAPWELMASAEL